MKQLHNFLRKLVRKGEPIGFSKVVAGLDLMEAIRRFIVLLFLAQEDKLSLWQEEDSGEIYITLMEGTDFEGTDPEAIRAG